MARILKTGLFGTAAMMALAALTSPAMAQEAQSSTALEEIVVTAQKREERLQDVPIAITAVTAASMEAKGIYGTQQLQQVSPSLVFRRTSSAGQIFMRGVGSYNTSIGDESPTAFYLDGIYIPNMSATIFAMNNIARVEVLRGPQGTLFGRNAAGGVVQVVTKDPSHTPTGSISVGYGSYEKTRVSAYASTGLTENLAADIAIIDENQHKGWGRNVTTGQKAFYEKNFGVRSKWVLDLGDTKASLALDYNRFEGDYGKRATPAPGYVSLSGDTYAGFYTTYADLRTPTVTKQGGAMLRLEHDMQWAQFVSLSSFRTVDGQQPIDQDGSSRMFGTAEIAGKEDTYTQEFQILSPKDSKVSWVGGLYYYNDDAKYDPLTIYTGTVAINTPVFIPSIGQTVNAGGAITNIPMVTTTIISRMKAKSYAAFGQATVEVLPKLSVTGGLRYTSDKRSIVGHVNTAADTAQSATFNKLTYKATADYKFTPDVMTYLQYSRGFKSGVYNIVSPTARAVRPSTVDAVELGFKSQFADDRVRLNAAVFHYKMKDLQSVQIVLGTQALFNAARARSKGFEIELDAQPIERLSVRMSAAYLDAKFTSFPGAPLQVANPLPNPRGGPSGFVNYVGDAAGAIMPNAPKWQLQGGLDYAVPTAIGDVTLSANAAYTDRIYSLDNKFSTPAYTIVNASIGWTSANERWSVKGLARNLFDKKYLVGYGPGFGPMSVNQTPGEPQTFEIVVGTRW